MLLIERKSYNVLGLKVSGPISFPDGKNRNNSVVAFSLVREAFIGFPVTLPVPKSDFQIYKKEFIIDNRGVERLVFRIELIKGLDIKAIEKKLLSSATWNASENPFCFLFSVDSNFQIMLLSNKNIYREDRDFYKKRAEDAMDFVLNYIKKNPSKIIINE